MFEKVCKVIYDVTGKTGITPETDFINDLMLNSFEIVSIIGIFEDEYKIKVKPREFWKLRKVSDVVEFLEGIQAGK